MAKSDLMKTTDSGGNSMNAFTNNSEMVLAIQGARGPPMLKKRNFFRSRLKRYYFNYQNGGQNMCQPKTFTAGFKSPPRVDAQGRGPPMTKKNLSFFAYFAPLPAIISYSLYRKTNRCKRVEEGFICRRGINKLLLYIFIDRAGTLTKEGRRRDKEMVLLL
jgi:hypothetical protein